MQIRTITTGIPNPFSERSLRRAAAFNEACRTHFETHGYAVQSTRVSCQIWDERRSVADIRALETSAQAAGIRFLSLGTVFPETPHTTANLTAMAEAIVQTEISFATVTLTTSAGTLASALMEPTAEIIQQIAHRTEAGYGNLRFAALMNCPPNTPFFPAAFWQGADMNFGIGWQAPDLVRRAFLDAPTLETALDTLKTVMETEGQRIVGLAEELASRHGVKFVGMDVSPAPMGTESIAYALEPQINGFFGEPGTLRVAAAVTETLRGLALPLCGYSGLMLPVLEDVGLGERSAAGHFNLDSLLLYSAVCGTGLDTIPLPGDVSVDRLASVLADVAALSTKLKKPLSVRVFPVPGCAAGERTRFDSPYLTNTLVMPI